MHEFSIARALLSRIDDEVGKHQATAVHRIRVRVGELSGVEMDLLESAFDLLRPGTSCDRSELELVRVPVVWNCPDCGAAIEPNGVLRCAECGGSARLASGDEILLERIEMEVA